MNLLGQIPKTLKNAPFCHSADIWARNRSRQGLSAQITAGVIELSLTKQEGFIARVSHGGFSDPCRPDTNAVMGVGFTDSQQIRPVSLTS